MDNCGEDVLFCALFDIGFSKRNAIFEKHLDWETQTLFKCLPRFIISAIFLVSEKAGIPLNPDIRKRVFAARYHLYGLRLNNYRAI